MLKSTTELTISVIVPSGVPSHGLSKLLRSWPNFPNWLRFEWIVISNSRQHVANAVPQRNGSGEIFHIVYPGKFNFSKAINLGIREASGDFLLFLNNDILFRNSDWILGAVRHLVVGDSDYVGAAEHVPRLNLYVCGFSFRRPKFLGAKNELVDEGLLKTRGCHCVDGLPLSAVLSKKSTVDRSLGLDERLPLGLNDVEFFLREKSRGVKAMVCTIKSVEHELSATRGNPRSWENLPRLVLDYFFFWYALARERR